MTFNQQKIICDKCKRLISKSNFNKHACFKESEIHHIRNLYDNNGLSLRDLIKQGFNKTLVIVALKGRKRSPSEANRLVHKLHPESFKMSDETKDKIRQKQVAFFKRNTGTSAFQRRFNGQMSYGEQKLHDLFIKNDVYKKYDVVNEYCEYPYFIDFAFINEKVAVEFDGKQHFTEKRQLRDKKRDEYLQQKGWRVYRTAYHEIENFDINVLISFIGDAKNKHHTYDLIKYREIKQQKHDIRKVERQKLKQQQQLNKAIVSNEQKRNKILSMLQLLSSIDMSKYGCISRAAELLNVSHTSVRRLLHTKPGSIRLAKYKDFEKETVQNMLV